MSTKILILGGTCLARQLAISCAREIHCKVTLSLAGRTSMPNEVENTKIISGGFGGYEGLASFLKKENMDILIDATHPFAENISRHAVQASAEIGIDLLRLQPAPWTSAPGDNWSHFDSLTSAVASIPKGKRIFSAIGQQAVTAFNDRPDLPIAARMIEPPKGAVPDHVRIITARPPYRESDDMALFLENRIELLIVKNAGGEASRGKLNAARTLQLPVYLLERPSLPSAPEFNNLDDLLSHLNF